MILRHAAWWNIRKYPTWHIAFIQTPHHCQYYFGTMSNVFGITSEYFRIVIQLVYWDLESTGLRSDSSYLGTLTCTSCKVYWLPIHCPTICYHIYIYILSRGHLKQRHVFNQFWINMTNSKDFDMLSKWCRKWCKCELTKSMFVGWVGKKWIVSPSNESNKFR